MLAAVLAFALQVRFLPITGMGRGFESVSVARSLAEHGAFADPFFGSSGPTAHLAPAYPLLLSVIYRATGYGPGFGVAAVCLTLVLQVLFVLLLFRLAGELFPDSRTRWIALALVVFLPLYPVIPASEGACLVAGVPAFWLLARRRGAIPCGLLGGALLLLNPALITILPPIAAFEWRRVKTVSAFLAVMLLVTVPWEIRNYQVFHKLFFVRDNLGLELDLANNDCKAFGTGDCLPHPMASAAERRKIAESGEPAYEEMRLRRAEAWFAAHPGAAASLTARRIAAFWFPLEEHPPYGPCISLVTAASLWGFWRLSRDRVALRWPLLSITALYPPVYYLVNFDVRYRAPILWIPVLAAAYGLARLRPIRRVL